MQQAYERTDPHRRLRPKVQRQRLALERNFPFLISTPTAPKRPFGNLRTVMSTWCTQQRSELWAAMRTGRKTSHKPCLSIWPGKPQGYPGFYARRLVAPRYLFCGAKLMQGERRRQNRESQPAQMNRLNNNDGALDTSLTSWMQPSTNWLMLIGERLCCAFMSGWNSLRWGKPWGPARTVPKKE